MEVLTSPYFRAINFPSAYATCGYVTQEAVSFNLDLDLSLVNKVFHGLCGSIQKLSDFSKLPGQTLSESVLYASLACGSSQL